MKVEPARLPVGRSESRQDRIEYLLSAILDELRKLNERRPSTDRDRAYLLRLLPAWAGSFGSQAVSALDLRSDPAIRELLDNMSTKRIGNLLAKAADSETAIASYMVSRSKRERGHMLWVLMKAP
jgi:hypothetical protein